MGFESQLAKKIAKGQRQTWPWKKIAGVTFVVFIVLTLTSSTTATDQAVIQLSTRHAYAKYLGMFDSKANVVMLGTISVEGWLVLKVPFRGHVSDLQSITFSEFVTQTGGLELAPEPYVVLRLPRGNSLVCHPDECYANGEWSLPYFSWQLRDTVAQGMWAREPGAAESSTMDLDAWAQALGDPSVIQIWIVVGGWETSKPYKVYVGDLAVNGVLVGLANAKRTQSSGSEPPLDF